MLIMKSASKVIYTLWSWLHLRGLDAPMIALLWYVYFLDKTGGVVASHRVIAIGFCLFLAVWVIYLSDRLVDSLQISQSRDDSSLRDRHHFAGQNKVSFLALILLATGTGLWLAANYLEAWQWALSLSLAAAVSIHLFLVQVSKGYSAELGCAVGFCTGVLLALWCVLPSFFQYEEAFLEGLIFASLCFLNCKGVNIIEENSDRKKRYNVALLVSALALPVLYLLMPLDLNFVFISELIILMYWLGCNRLIDRGAASQMPDQALLLGAGLGLLLLNIT